jgi:hypothetical protein
MEQKKRAFTHIGDMILKDFDPFLDSRCEKNSALRKNYACRLKGFQRHIGLSEIKVQKNHNPKNDKSLRYYELEKKYAKKEKELAGEKEISVACRQTVDERDAEIDRLNEEKDTGCSQCKKLAERDDTIDKLRTENKEKDGIFDVERAEQRDKIRLLNQGLEIKNGELESKEGESASLKTDNEFLKKALEEQSHDKLLEENQYLKVQLGQKDTDNERKQNRIREVEQLIEIERRQKGEIVTRVLRTVRECKEYMPSTNESFSIAEYKRNSLKSMTNLEDYINGLCQDT